MELDRISDLPGNVMDQILSYMPIRDAVKTCVLSTKWRYKYETLPILVFDDDHWLPTFESNSELAKKIVAGIDRVLLLHSGPIYKFSLNHDAQITSDDIEKWILYLSRRHLKVFELRLGNEVYFPIHLPSSIFSCESLTHLDLSKCLLRPLSTFTGLKNLKSLCLYMVVVDQGVLETLISGSLVLEIFLMLEPYCTIKHLSINAPKLQQLIVDEVFIPLSLENTSHLTEFSVQAQIHTKVCEDGFYFRKLLGGMPQIQKIDIGRYYLQCLSDGDVPDDIQLSLVNLHHMSISVNFTNSKEMLCLFGLLKCAPNLQELHIQCFGDDGLEKSSNCWESDNSNRPFTSLQYISISNMYEHKAEMDFIKFMLKASPALETMTIYLRSRYCTKRKESTKVEVSVETTKQLLSFKRASPESKIIFK